MNDYENKYKGGVRNLAEPTCTELLGLEKREKE